MAPRDNGAHHASRHNHIQHGQAKVRTREIFKFLLKKEGVSIIWNRGAAKAKAVASTAGAKKHANGKMKLTIKIQ